MLNVNAWKQPNLVEALQDVPILLFDVVLRVHAGYIASFDVLTMQQRMLTGCGEARLCSSALMGPK